MGFSCFILSIFLFSSNAFGAASFEGIDFESPVGIDMTYHDSIIWIPPDDKQVPVVPHGPDIFITEDDKGNALLQIPESYRVSLQDAVSEAARKCGGGAKFRKRDLVGCMINQAEAYARDDSVMELLDPRQIRKFKLQVRRGQQKLLELSRRFKDLVDLNRAMLFMGAAFETQTVGWTAGGLVLAGGAILPLGDFMKFVPVNDAGDQEDFPDQGTTVVPLPTDTSSGCPPRASDDFPTDCADGDCQGQNEEKCTVGPEKGCPCKPYGRGIVDDYDVEFGNQQQELFKRLLADTPMDCSFGTLGEYADGKAIMEPSAWCVCTTASTTAYYPTRTETGDGACAYTSLPKETISPEQNPPPATTTEPPNPCDTQTVEVPGRCGVPACQYVLAADKGVAALCGEEDYCFCDGVAVALLTSVHDGSTSLGCGYETLPTKDACPTKTVDPPKATSPPKINRPGPMEHCLKDSDCNKFVCNGDGRRPSCNYDAEPGAAYCRC